MALLGIIAGGVGLALLSARDPGYLLVTWDGWRLEVRSLVAALLVLAAVFWVLHMITLGVNGALHLPARLRDWRTRRALRELESGARGLCQGEYQRAERQFLRHVRESPVPLLHHLGAAWAAHRLGAAGRRDELFAAARAALKGGEPELTLVQARLQLEALAAPAAEELLDAQRRAVESTPAGLELMFEARARSGSHWDVLKLLPRLQRRRLLDGDAAAHAELEAHRLLLESSPVPAEHWRRLPRRLRDQPVLLAACARALVRSGNPGRALEMLGAALGRRLDDRLLEVFGDIEAPDPVAQLGQAEAWLTRHPRDATLLYTVGRIARRAGQWSRARSFLETSVTLAPRPAARRLLGELLLELGQSDAALAQFRAGMREVTQLPGTP